MDVLSEMKTVLMHFPSLRTPANSWTVDAFHSLFSLQKNVHARFLTRLIRVSREPERIAADGRI
jgi:hypothetical protein